MQVQKIKLEPIKNTVREQTGKIRVAAYCRVSTDTDDQKTSFEGQVKHYTELICSNPEWEMAGVFADEGITGTSASKRPEFQRMVAECEEGKIDLVLTKSISRFARNTIECLTYVRHLNNLGVHIVFESNNIDTRAAFSEMLLTILAAFAQEESRSISENTIWGIRKRFEEGITRWCRLYGYEKTADGEYQIVPDQAAVVQKVFELYEHGESIQNIRKYLTAQSIKSPTGEPKWSNSAVHTLLINERYAGDILLQKFCVENHISHKAIRNDSTEIPSYFIENHHTPIVSRKQYDRVQKIMGMRRVNGRVRGEDTGTCNQYPLGEKLRCPYCGSTLYQRTIPVQVKRSAGWRCEKGDHACQGFIIRSYLVEAALLEAYRRLDAAKIEEKVKSPRFGNGAKLALEMKKAHPSFSRVDFWWVDDLIDHIEFGKHSKTEREYRRMVALGEKVIDDRTMKVYWKCGLITTVMSGVKADREHPAYIAGLFNDMLERAEQKAAGQQEVDLNVADLKEAQKSTQKAACNA